MISEPLHVFPAYKIYALHEQMQNGQLVKVLPAKARVCVLRQTTRHGLLPRIYQPGCVAECAVRYNECPIERMADAKAKGHDLYWLNESAVSITAWERPQETIFAIEVGDKVWYMGHYFEIQYANKYSKDHLKLVEIELPAKAEVAA
jgi:hypothetical protein